HFIFIYYLPTHSLFGLRDKNILDGHLNVLSYEIQKKSIKQSFFLLKKEKLKENFDFIKYLDFKDIVYYFSPLINRSDILNFK
ncbi:hypothetical protein LIT13_15060, partial [Flavobacterium psychrophilum]|uniref:hypothetical protein n=1 Tax=Flavobacterium psychrophilum TaxID=96345 RepID=UPI001D091E4F